MSCTILRIAGTSEWCQEWCTTLCSWSWCRATGYIAFHLHLHLSSSSSSSSCREDCWIIINIKQIFLSEGHYLHRSAGHLDDELHLPHQHPCPHSLLYGSHRYWSLNPFNTKIDVEISNHQHQCLLFSPIILICGKYLILICVEYILILIFSFCILFSGYRDTKFYKLNKWAWWYSYVVFRLFGIPWFSAQMWFTMAPIRVQAPLVCIVYYFSGNLFFPFLRKELSEKKTYILLPLN